MNDVKDIEHFIREHPFFEGMPDEDIKRLTGCAKRVCFPAGTFIFKEGEEARTFFCIQSGQVALEIHAPPKGTFQIDSRKAGDVVGWSWIVVPYRWYCDVRAVEEVRALAFDGACLRGQWDENPRLGYEMYQRFVPLMHRSLQATRLQLLDIYGTN